MASLPKLPISASPKKISLIVIGAICIVACKKNTSPPEAPGVDLYVGGYSTTADNYTEVPTYWKNGSITTLTPLSSQILAIKVVGDDVYTAGITKGSGSYQQAIFWKNGAAQILANPPLVSGANGLFVQGTDVYVGGFINSNNHSAAVYLGKTIHLSPFRATLLIQL